WRAGREAAKYDVYLSTDEQAVIDGNTPVNTVADASYSPLPLDLGSTYYWRIDEVNEAETPTTWQGDIWSFSTQEFLVVDDFESYNDLNPEEPGSNRIFYTWIDGYDNPATNGSVVGYADAPFAEQSIVYDGKQSVPLFYDNTVATYSEATVNVANLQAGQDWTKHGIKALTLYFFGDPNNAVEQMYVKVNGSKVTYDGDAENIRRTGWQMWYIDLASLGVSLSNVTELSIGFERIGAFGGQGVVYLDGIRLYSHDRQVITPAEAGTTGLQAHYEFEGTYSDSSGNARHGTAMGNPTFVAGKVGQAISLRGLNDYVEITGYKGILGPNAFSITTWIKTTFIGDETQEIVYYGTHSNGQRCEFRVHTNGRIRMGNGAGQVESLTAVTDGGWHHVAATITENATNSSSDVRIYVDGQDDTQESTDPDAFNIVADWDVTIGYRPSQSDRFFNGQIDDVRIYDRVLSQEEIAWLAGRTKPFDKPF
ncbi:MAG: LamG domain-containing protein, partial [Planctomycetes bacterium]|nr:LamG domain-containing protein [Planctomycetota bacterium]